MVVVLKGTYEGIIFQASRKAEFISIWEIKNKCFFNNNFDKFYTVVQHRWAVLSTPERVTSTGKGTPEEHVRRRVCRVKSCGST